MAHPDLTGPGAPEGADLSSLRALVPRAAAQAFADGDDRLTATLLQRARDACEPGTLAWAVLERLLGLAFIHVQREVEGTFALERADALLDELCGAQGSSQGSQVRPDLEWLDLDESGGNGAEGAGAVPGVPGRGT
ncbi:hypothetical protein [Deinococcus knuensis]|uniref:Uncharacterized protein n=1 Tax=Deinococcus knuensis TaxID=1837380 RepID=A0ABQ2SNF2_9DEIO|nr:hypothetical protein [Deinococcus knuensis]GGS35309.1 hypothetical protein GCM10008961_28840 [Deinococcus knuensis]